MPLSLAHILSFLFIHLPQAPGRHPQPFPISSFPYTAPFPVRPTSPPQLFLCMQRPTRMRLDCLGACIVIFPEAEKVPSGPWNHRSLREAFTLLGRVPASRDPAALSANQKAI